MPYVLWKAFWKGMGLDVPETPPDAKKAAPPNPKNAGVPGERRSRPSRRNPFPEGGNPRR